MNVYDISPDYLDRTAGRWTPTRHGIQRWVDIEPERIIACPQCRAATTEPCRRPNGESTHNPHSARTSPQTCPCGAPREHRRQYCEKCRVERRRATGRQVWARRRRDLLDELGDVEGIA